MTYTIILHRNKLINFFWLSYAYLKPYSIHSFREYNQSIDASVSFPLLSPLASNPKCDTGLWPQKVIALKAHCLLGEKMEAFYLILLTMFQSPWSANAGKAGIQNYKEDNLFHYKT
jgi:hypothetical protein